MRTVAHERLLAARLDLGDAALVPELESLVAQDPLREERWRLLVLALYRAQRQADALAALRRARSTLVESLGVDPGPELRPPRARGPRAVGRARRGRGPPAAPSVAVPISALPMRRADPPTGSVGVRRPAARDL